MSPGPFPAFQCCTPKSGRQSLCNHCAIFSDLTEENGPILLKQIDTNYVYKEWTLALRAGLILKTAALLRSTRSNFCTLIVHVQCMETCTCRLMYVYIFFAIPSVTNVYCLIINVVLYFPGHSSHGWLPEDITWLCITLSHCLWLPPDASILLCCVP